ncbi:hypothetical protein [Oryza sativa Japonica Group]|uniref:Uncharacterized protein n=1 Tax=Oryza sativa subsp. japonica TaxID=39947 RepID=Q5Z8P8_ORYSJ|nr:hypothetical protein [Oryza sativa Japonica Group]BAD53849.1 hypothetical protein [Oryza sativa Japonica Group]
MRPLSSELSLASSSLLSLRPRTNATVTTTSLVVLLLEYRWLLGGQTGDDCGDRR